MDSDSTTISFQGRTAPFRKLLQFLSIQILQGEKMREHNGTVGTDGHISRKDLSRNVSNTLAIIQGWCPLQQLDFALGVIWRFGRLALQGLAI